MTFFPADNRNNDMSKPKVKDLRAAIEARLQHAVDQKVYLKGSKQPKSAPPPPNDNDDLDTIDPTQKAVSPGEPRNGLEKIVDNSMSRKWGPELKHGIQEDATSTTFDEVIRRLTRLEAQIKKLSDHLIKGQK